MIKDKTFKRQRKNQPAPYVFMFVGLAPSLTCGLAMNFFVRLDPKEKMSFLGLEVKTLRNPGLTAFRNV